MRQLYPAVLILLVSLAGFAPTTRKLAADEQEQRPNFLVVLCDDLGYGDLGCYGHPAIKTPHLDRLAQQGMRLTDCYSSAPVCSSSRAGLLTGRTPSRIGVYDWIPGGHPMHLRREEMTVATLLRDAGYATSHVGKWHCNGKFNSPEQPQPGDHGFDHWMSTQNNASPSHLNPRNFVRNGETVGEVQGYSCQIVADEAIRWLKEGRDKRKPFFQFVCFHEPHEPIDSPPELVDDYPQATKRGEALYYANVANMDRAVGRLMTALDELQLAESTLVFFTSDNGPETLNRYRGAWRSHGSPGPLRGMKLHIYDGGIRVPGILRFPGHIAPGKVVGEPVCGLDVLPTLCELGGAKVPRDRAIDGASFTSVFKGRPVPRRTPLFWHYYRAFGQTKAAMRDGDWMVIGLWDGPQNRPGTSVFAGDVELIKKARLVDFELYNVRKDIGQQHNLADREPERLKAMSERLVQTYREVQREGPEWKIAAARRGGANFASRWPQGVARVWPGEEYYANRFLDWRIRNGRLECIIEDQNKPMRTVHLLTRAAGERPGTLKMMVRTGSLLDDRQQHANTWTGFLIGVGGEHVDFRISALCHHWPAADGGLIAAIDGNGNCVFRDNSRLGSQRPSSIQAWPLIKPDTVEGQGFAEGPVSDIELHLVAEPHKGKYLLTLAAHDAESGRLISKAIVDGIDPQQVSGNVALVSHSMSKQQGPGYWFRDWSVWGSKVDPHPERAFGPVLAAQHTLSRGVLKMTAQMPPLGKRDTQTAELQIRRGPNEPWQVAATGELRDHSFTIPFRVENWDGSQPAQYRIAYYQRTGPRSTEPHFYDGTIRRIPADKEDFVVAAFTGHHISAKGEGHWNGSSIWYPHNELVAAVRHHKPDLLFFSGDQIYESGLAGIVREPADVAAIDYQYHWYRWCWAFRNLARDIPCICIPDDHDVYHGNIWGAGGRDTDGYGRVGQDSGGYTMDPLFVNAVHATQTSHLPDPVDPGPIDQGISVYFTRMEYGGLSFAIIADRMWKSSPTVAVPQGNCVNGWFLNPEFDPAKEADVPGAVLLGERQLEFLEHWANDWRHGPWMKVLLSQTIFANVATLPKTANNDGVVPRLRYAKPGEYIEGDQLAADADSNSWPQTGRNKALRAIRRGFAFHIAGDQHLGSFTQYGVDDWNDAPYAFCVPSIANVWPRRWFPPTPGANRKPGAPPYTGEHKDGFGNLITVHAVSNPVESGVEPTLLYDRAPGYGIVHFNRQTRKIRVECWPRWVDPARPDAKQYHGWPVTIDQEENYGRRATGYLPTLKVSGMSDPVVQVAAQQSGEVLYTLRIRGASYRPKVFGPGSYTVHIGEPGTTKWKTLQGLQISEEADQTIAVRF